MNLESRIERLEKEVGIEEKYKLSYDGILVGASLENAMKLGCVTPHIEKGDRRIEISDATHSELTTIVNALNKKQEQQ